MGIGLKIAVDAWDGDTNYPAVVSFEMSESGDAVEMRMERAVVDGEPLTLYLSAADCAELGSQLYIYESRITHPRALAASEDQAK